MKKTVIVLGLFGLFLALTPTTEVISANYDSRHSDREYNEFNHSERRQENRSHHRDDTATRNHRSERQTNRHCH